MLYAMNEMEKKEKAEREKFLVSMGMDRKERKKMNKREWYIYWIVPTIILIISSVLFMRDTMIARMYPNDIRKICELQEAAVIAVWIVINGIYFWILNRKASRGLKIMTNNTEILRTEGLKRSYLVNETKIDVLKGINLTINNQEFIAIMGKSGSGKTTLLKLLGLLDRPTEGKVFFKGEDSNSLRGDRLAMIRRREIGFIYQDYYLMDSLSVRENIMLPKILDHSPVEESITEAEKLADIMGVRALLDKKIFELSGGEKQRAAICRALMNHSDLILADEPTGNLDSASSETVMEYLQMINKDLKKAVVLVTHDAYVASFCDRVIFVKDGNIEVQLRKKEKQDVFCDKIMKAQKDILKNK